jgi:hypothetical protein
MYAKLWPNRLNRNSFLQHANLLIFALRLRLALCKGVQKEECNYYTNTKIVKFMHPKDMCQPCIGRIGQANAWTTLTIGDLYIIPKCMQFRLLIILLVR